MTKRDRRGQSEEGCWHCDGKKIVLSVTGKKKKCPVCHGTGILAVKES